MAGQALKKGGSQRIVLAEKGTKTLFDRPCACDDHRSAREKSAWLDRMSVPTSPISDDTKEWVRRLTVELVGRSWWTSRAGAVTSNDGQKESEYPRIPDQRGCLEQKAGLGGTLSVARTDEQIAEIESRGATPGNKARDTWKQVRVGVGKTKGKHRVVTMQSANSKRVLRPVHERLYDHLTSFGWCVRGDVTADDLDAVVKDRNEGAGEYLISGDYSAATDNLFQDAVYTVVQVLAEALPEGSEERIALLGSFRPNEVVGQRGGHIGWIRRGSMMGNLVSFPVLCILNRICHARACDLYGYPRSRRVRINGDDCAFSGSRGFFEVWKGVTGELGFVVNEEKTGFSTRYLELNSEIYDSHFGSFVRKLTFGWLATDSERAPIHALFETCSRLSFATAVFVLTSNHGRAVMERGFWGVGEIPARWWSFLTKRKWFRRLASRDPPASCPEESASGGRREWIPEGKSLESCLQGQSQAGDGTWDGVLKRQLGVPNLDSRERKLPFVPGKPLAIADRRLEYLIRVLDARAMKEWLHQHEGVAVKPPAKRCGYSGPPKPSDRRLETGRIVRKPVCYRLWLEPTLRAVQDVLIPMRVCRFADPAAEWIDDQPGLVMGRTLAIEHSVTSFPPILEGEWVRYRSHEGCWSVCQKGSFL